MTAKSNKYILSICLVFLIITLYASFYTVNAGEQVILTQFGTAYKLPVTKPGLHLRMPFIQRVHYLPNHRVFELSTGLISSQIAGYGRASLMVYIQYKIRDPLKYFINFGTNLKNKEPTIQALKSSLSTVSKDNGIFETDDFSNSQKQTLKLKNGAEDRVLKMSNALLNSKGIQIVKLGITIKKVKKGSDLPLSHFN